jgi:hypothetical protein
MLTTYRVATQSFFCGVAVGGRWLDCRGVGTVEVGAMAWM